MGNLKLASGLCCNVLVALFLLTGHFALAQDASSTVSTSSLDEFINRYPSGSIQSEQTANQALLEADQQRAVLDEQYAKQANICYSKFFATSCLDSAKETRRLGVNQIRKVEVESNAFIRSNNVAERDRNLAERREKDANNPPKPLTEMLPKKPQPEHNNNGEDRVAEHAAKMQQERQEEITNAQKRADDVAAFNKKTQDALDRQREVAKKKAEKAEKAAAKAAADAAASAKAAASTSAKP